MSRYLIDKFKGQYRILCPTCLVTNDFPKEIDGTYSTNDIYIPCANNVQVYHLQRNILETYIPSLGRGRGIVRRIKEAYPDLILKIQETDSEVLFQFKAEDMDNIAPYIKPRTLGADISPWSSKNRPKKQYCIPDEDLKQYEEVVAVIPPAERLAISHMTQAFFRTKYKSKKAYEAHKQNIKTSGLRAKEYIHSVGLWNDYVKYLNKEINK